MASQWKEDKLFSSHYGNNCVCIHHDNMAEANLISPYVELIGFEADCINALTLLVGLVINTRPLSHQRLCLMRAQKKC